MQCHRRCHPQALRQLQQGHVEGYQGKKSSMPHLCDGLLWLSLIFTMGRLLLEGTLTALPCSVCISSSMTRRRSWLLWTSRSSWENARVTSPAWPTTWRRTYVVVVVWRNQPSTCWLWPYDCLTRWSCWHKLKTACCITEALNSFWGKLAWEDSTVS